MTISNETNKSVQGPSGIRSLALPAVYGAVGIFLVFVLDILTGKEISFSIFYLLPISFIAWASGLRLAILASLLSGLCWYFADLKTGNMYSHGWIPIWNAFMRTLIFTTVGVILSKLKVSMAQEQQARKIATDATRAKSDFLANMSHEIRTPLNAIIGAADILSETELTDEQSEYLEIFKIEGEQARRLLNDILDYSKIEAHRIQFERAAFGLRKLIETACQSLEPRCREKGIKLHWSVSDDLKDSRMGDPYRLRQVLTNLLNNAVKFTEKGGVALRVEGTSTTVHVSVQDTGIGIPEDQQADLFGRFNQANASVSRRFGGSGLGLSIAKGLVEKMEGQIGFNSVANQGTEFFFDVSLPESDASPDAATEGGVAQIPDIDLTSPTRILRFLLVDDYEFNRRIIGHFLRNEFVIVELAENGKVGLQKVVANEYDLVLLDMHMPEMDGWTVAREVRAWEKAQLRERSLPIIALTASALKEDEERCLAAGCTAFLGKPIRKKELLNEIERVLKLKFWGAGKTSEMTDEPEIDPEIAKLVPGFLDEVAQHCESLIQSAGHCDFAKAPETAHQLIGMGGTYGFGRISELARQIETVAIRKEPIKLARLAGELKAYVYELKETYE
jgi:signal transduction histidine kinase/CheY-like chemotaxis protein